MKVYFVRHGESEANLLGEFSNRGFKHGLTEKGKAQAIALSQQLGEVAVTQILSSPLLRAVQTAEILANALKVPYKVDDALCEYDCGVLEGKSDVASWAEYQRVLDEWVTHHRWESRIEEGESFNEIKERFVPFIDRLVTGYEDSPGGVVLIGHGGLYRCMLPLVIENVDFDFVMQHSLENTGYAKVEVEDRKLLCVAWNGTEISIRCKSQSCDARPD